MSEIIIDKFGNEVEVLIRTTVNGMIDTIIKAESQEIWETAALHQKLIIDTEDGLKSVPGANIDVIGPITIEPATFDSEGKIIKEAVMDNSYHINLRISEPLLSAIDDDGFLKWKTTAITWSKYGTTSINTNKKETGLVVAGVTMIDPDSIHTPSRVFA